MSTIDIDGDAARDAAQRELGKPIYPKASATDRLIDWLEGLLARILAEASSVPGGWFTITVLILLVVVAAVVAIRVATRTMRTNRRDEGTLFDAHDLSAAQHRAAAEQAAAQGAWAAAIRHRLRAVARELEETAVLNPAPGRTATELARDAGSAIPGLAAELRSAADIFNDVTYGAQPGTEPGYRSIAELDEHLRTHAGARVEEPVAASPNAAWVEVR